jgi:hypothetical protein
MESIYIQVSDIRAIMGLLFCGILSQKGSENDLSRVTTKPT